MITVFIGASCAYGHTNRVAESQQIWLPQYAKQENAPKPEAMLLNSDPEPELTDGFLHLYSGRDLSGWTSHGGTCTFEAVGENIVTTCVPGSPSTYLLTDRNDFRDFIFTCEVKWEVDGNSGIQFRSKVRPGENGGFVFGPQIELEEESKTRGWTGAIYGQSCGGYWCPLWLEAHEEARKAVDYRDWNRITVEARGRRVKSWVNGIPAGHFVFPNDDFAAGSFGIQSHSGTKGTLRFRNLRVKELAPQALSDP